MSYAANRQINKQTNPAKNIASFGRGNNCSSHALLVHLTKRGDDRRQTDIHEYIRYIDFFLFFSRLSLFFHAVLNCSL